MDQTETANLLNRAFRAFLASDSGSAEQTVESCSAVRCLNGLSYVVLGNERRTLAVYRIRHNGPLRRLRCWPISLGRAAAPADVSRSASSLSATSPTLTAGVEHAR